MSFGWSAGDILAAAQLLWDLYKALDDAEGAPGHYRQTAATLKSIQFRLRFLVKVIGGDPNSDQLVETEEASHLAAADKEDLHSVTVNLKISMEKLEALVAKGCDMKLDPGVKRRRRDWPLRQINKLRWYSGKEDEVNSLVQHIFELTTPLPDFYHQLNSEAMKTQAVARDVYHETELKWLKTIYEKLSIVEKDVARGRLLKIDKEKSEEGQSFLLAGPELGIAPIAPEPNFGRESAMAHLKSIAYEVVGAGLQTRMKNLRAGHQLKHKLTRWFSGETPTRLWLYGDQASTVSAILYSVALDRRRPVIAYAGHHSAASVQLALQDRLFRMVYSLLFQLLQQFDSVTSFVVTEVGRPFTALGLSIESMPLALDYLRYFLGILPECICIVDGWNFISDFPEGDVKKILEEFLALFSKSTAPATGDYESLRLLITTRGNSPMLRDMGKDAVDSFDLKGHVGEQGQRLYTTLLGIEW